jgi:hypothetical protein
LLRRRNKAETAFHFKRLEVDNLWITGAVGDVAKPSEK